MWTRFLDMHSGGKQKLDWGVIYLEAPEAKAAEAFTALFGRNPDHVTCACCGEDYSYRGYEHETLEEATLYERADLRGNALITVDELLDQGHGAAWGNPTVRAVRRDEIAAALLKGL